MRVVVVGGGIAGLATAAFGARVGLDVILLEREPQLMTHSSSRNAAMFRCIERDATRTELALRSWHLLESIAEGTRLINPCGMTIAASSETLAPLLAVAESQGVPMTRVATEDLRQEFKLSSDYSRCGVFTPIGGVLDVSEMGAVLARQAKRAGARIELGRAVQELRFSEQGAAQVVTDRGVLEADRVVLSAGAWSRDLARAAGCDLPLEPLRRHLVHLDYELKTSVPFWDIERDVYFRAESGGVLASPCDEAISPPCLPVAEPAAVELLHGKLQGVAAKLSEAGLRRSWACLRTFARDRVSIIGADPRQPRLYWLGGLGGHGMTVGLAAGERVANQLCETEAIHDSRLSPGRLSACPAPVSA